MPREAGEIVASRGGTCREGSGAVTITDRGEYEIKGIPGRWPIYAVA
jgi:hypothetical protein